MMDDKTLGILHRSNKLANGLNAMDNNMANKKGTRILWTRYMIHTIITNVIKVYAILPGAGVVVSIGIIIYRFIFDSLFFNLVFPL